MHSHEKLKESDDKKFLYQIFALQWCTLMQLTQYDVFFMTRIESFAEEIRKNKVKYNKYNLENKVKTDNYFHIVLFLALQKLKIFFETQKSSLFHSAIAFKCKNIKITIKKWYFTDLNRAISY